MECVRVGTSGWVYKHWAESFYPEDWPKSDELQFYATQFPTVEINATFYRLPTESMVKGWYRKVPDDFLFAVKGSRFITHIKRLKETGAALDKYFERILPLNEHLGPILWQLPPNFQKNQENADRLERFVKAVPPKLKHAIEFRHPSWIEESTYALLRCHNVASTWLSSQRMPMDFTITADFVYLRFHGLEGGAAHDYTKGELKPWADQLLEAARHGKPCYVYFNNDWNTRAPQNAKTLMDMLGEASKQPAQTPLPRATISRPGRSPVKEPRSKRLAAARRSS